MIFIINGKVTDETTGNGVTDVRVEAWDKDSDADDFLGSSATSTDPRAAKRFDAGSGDGEALSWIVAAARAGLFQFPSDEALVA